MRPIVKVREPATVTETRAAATTDLSEPRRARAAFDQIDKARARGHLAQEQGFLCAFCMLRIDPEDEDERGAPTMKIAHRTPIEVDPAQALSWKNLLGSCDGGQRSGGRRWSCDAAQGPKALTVDPTDPSSCARLGYERHDGLEGLFITSGDATLKADVEVTLALNAGDLPALREACWRAFCTLQQKHAPKRYGRDERKAYFDKWIQERRARLPEMLGVIEAMLR